MGIHDRDWYRDMPHKGSGSTTTPRATAKAGWLGLPTWAIWIGLIVVGLIAAKYALDLRKSAIPFPATGQVHWYVEPQGGPLAQLSIESPRTSASQFVVKLDHWESKQPVALIPVRGGETATVQVPLGLYRVTIVKGSLWRGPAKLFGTTSDAKEAVEPMSFHKIGNTITGHTIRLETLAGNMETRPSRLGH